MPRIPSIPRSDLEQFAPMFAQLEELFGFLPNDYLTMARKPGFLEAVVQLTEVAFLTESALPMDLKVLLTYASSRAAGCAYCTAHAGELAVKNGISVEKLQSIRDFESSELFNKYERAALRLAQGANTNPNSVSDLDFKAAREHLSEEQIVDVVAVIAMMSVYNKWNDTMATELEKPPAEFASKKLNSIGWTIGKHAAD